MLTNRRGRLSGIEIDEDEFDPERLEALMQPTDFRRLPVRYRTIRSCEQKHRESFFGVAVGMAERIHRPSVKVEERDALRRNRFAPWFLMFTTAARRQRCATHDHQKPRQELACREQGGLAVLSSWFVSAVHRLRLYLTPRS